jgi:hypothetical protein
MTTFGGPAFEETVSAVTTDPSVDLGSRRMYEGEEFVYCYNAGSDQAIAGEGVRIVTAASGYSFTQSGVTDVYNPCLGVVKHATITTGAYGWVMVRGYQSVEMVSATTADFLPIALGDAGDFVEAEAEVTTAGTGAPCGLAMNANTGAGGTVYAFIKTAF